MTSWHRSRDRYPRTFGLNPDTPVRYAKGQLNKLRTNLRIFHLATISIGGASFATLLIIALTADPAADIRPLRIFLALLGATCGIVFTATHRMGVDNYWQGWLDRNEVVTTAWTRYPGGFHDRQPDGTCSCGTVGCDWIETPS